MDKDERLIARALKVCEKRAELETEILIDSHIVKDLVTLWFNSLDQSREHFGVIALSAKNQVLDKRILFSGTTDRANIYPKEIFRWLLTVDRASSFVVAHNHPSGNPEPSRADITLANTLNRLGGELDFRLLDSVIVSGGGFSSLASRGLI